MSDESVTKILLRDARAEVSRLRAERGVSGHCLAAARAECAKLRVELGEARDMLNIQREALCNAEGGIDAEFYQSQIDDVREFFLAWRGDYGDVMMKFCDGILDMLGDDMFGADRRLVPVDRLDKQTALGDKLRLAMHYGRELAEKDSAR